MRLTDAASWLLLALTVAAMLFVQTRCEALLADNPEPPKKQDKIQGTWKEIAWTEKDFQPTPECVEKEKSVLIITDNTIIWMKKGVVKETFKYQLKTTKMALGD